MIPKAKLIDGQWYAGRCRNARYAVWDAKRGIFHHLRCKFGNWFEEEIKHSEDDTRFDVFEPYAELNFEAIISQSERVNRAREQDTTPVRHERSGDGQDKMPPGSIF